MSVPTEYDFAVIKIGDGADPEVFAISCGKQDFTANFVAISNDRFVRDCAKPGEVPFRKSKANGKQLDITATGLTDVDTMNREAELVGTHQNVKLEYYADNGTDAGLLLATVSCNMLVGALNIGSPRENAASAEITLASNGAWTFAKAP